MITGIDHIVIAVKSLERAVATYNGLGFSVVEGGRHPYGSHNALVGFADGSYIEILGFYEESPGHPWWDLLHRRGGGLVDFCMATDDIRRDLAAFRAQGAQCGDLVEGGRARPDGFQVKWINNKVSGADQGLIPFIIEDATPRDERLPAARDHANGVTGIDCLTLVADDIARHAGIMAAVLDRDGEAIADEALGASGLRFDVGTHALEYLAPEREDSALRLDLSARVPATYGVRFKTTGAARRFDPVETEGVRLSFET